MRSVRAALPWPLWVLSAVGCVPEWLQQGRFVFKHVVIGHYASLTGDTATFGTSADEGARLALDEVNKAGGVLGKQVKLITEDDRSLSPRRAPPPRS
jgi:ABC-type branched-subunit amino acid transport system substrate-binding protein